MEGQGLIYSKNDLITLISRVTTSPQKGLYFEVDSGTWSVKYSNAIWMKEWISVEPLKNTFTVKEIKNCGSAAASSAPGWAMSTARLHILAEAMMWIYGSLWCLLVSNSLRSQWRGPGGVTEMTRAHLKVTGKLNSNILLSCLNFSLNPLIS